MSMKELAVKEDGDLFSYLLSLGFGRSRVKQLLKFNSVSVNGSVAVRHDQLLCPGDRVSLSFEKKAVPDLQPKHGLQVLYEDEALVVIDKPAGLLTIGTDKERTKTAYFQLNEYLRQRDPDRKERVFIVHRLDQDTSGLIVFAKSEAVKRRLQTSWKDVDKRYLALVEGVPRKHEDTIAGYLNESGVHRVYESKDSGHAKYAVTKYKLLKSGREYSLLEVDIETGRKHQIRVHLSGIGHPVAGDRKYNAGTDPIKRLALHACRLSLPHPLTKRRIEFESALPQAFGPLVSRMKEYS
jgi:23S rRNA pseudouridine1911/1915/1917 synthase